MKEYIKKYQIELTTQSPVFIGDGRELNKKEYIKSGNLVYVPDLEKMYSVLVNRRLEREFENFMMKEGIKDLGQWLRHHNVSPKESEQFSKYTLNAGDVFLNGRGSLAINTFIKDAYGCPYIPGSSMKGVLRTIVLAYLLKKDARSFEQESAALVKLARTSNQKRKWFLKDITGKIEKNAFYTLDRRDIEDKPIDGAENDFMSCLLVSDSRPLDIKDLVLCQKIDVFNDGSENSLNVTRECIKPNTKIYFDLTITEEFPLSLEELREAIQLFVEEYELNFLSKFHVRNLRIEKPRPNTIWLGGGAGFVSKTVLYPMLGCENGVETVSNVLQKTINADRRERQHRNADDVKKGVSPHTLKCTKCQGKYYEFGRCDMKIL